MSNTYKVAHIREQGVDLIIIPLDSAFGHKSTDDQNDIIAGLQACATSAGLKGTVVPMWRESGRPRFRAPTRWHAYFGSITEEYVWANINRELTCG